MKKSEVVLGKEYAVKVSGRIARVKLVSESPYGGWNAVNLITKREIRIRSAAKLRYEWGTYQDALNRIAERRAKRVLQKCLCCGCTIGACVHDGCSECGGKDGRSFV